jgi:hypothetical protein
MLTFKRFVLQTSSFKLQLRRFGKREMHSDDPDDRVEVHKVKKVLTRSAREAGPRGTIVSEADESDGHQSSSWHWVSLIQLNNGLLEKPCWKVLDEQFSIDMWPSRTLEYTVDGLQFIERNFYAPPTGLGFIYLLDDSRSSISSRSHQSCPWHRLTDTAIFYWRICGSLCS